MKLKSMFDGIQVQYMNGIGLGLYRHHEFVIAVDDETDEAGLMPIDSITLQLPFCRVMFFKVED